MPELQPSPTKKLTQKQARKVAYIWAANIIAASEWHEPDIESGDLVLREMILLSLRLSPGQSFSSLEDIVTHVRHNF